MDAESDLVFVLTHELISTRLSILCDTVKVTDSVTGPVQQDRCAAILLGDG